ncbi:MAG: hypothetical protein Hyperionvirus2_130 [Hyperionvirus sp.]|uniref:Uncharacterized protein n=1 Tax=Hyperionvirus sp. TaxID=2487770 RepID=A0A3G5A6V2_9VIRU|nr:MAG: hypothetical protein Hyperionvirus2_130 [Hyperionvirus sp.]
MTEIKLAGLRIYLFRDSSYLIPLYSFKCPCDLWNYIGWWGEVIYAPDDYKFIRPKYLKKFQELRSGSQKLISESQYYYLIPHFKIDKQIVKCEHISEYLNPFGPRKNFFGSFTQHARKMQNKTAVDFISELKAMSHLPIGNLVADLIIDYWVTGHYRWFEQDKPLFNLTFDQMKKSVEDAFETNFLTTIQENTSRFESEIKSVLNVIMPLDLVKIIYSYGYSAADTLGKILSIVQGDLLKYAEIIA